MTSRALTRRRAHGAERVSGEIARSLSNAAEGFGEELGEALSQRAAALGHSADDLADRVHDASRSWILKARRQARRRPAAFGAVVAIGAALATAAVVARLAKRS